MSPRVTFLFTLAGVLLVGLPLPLLTRNAETQAAPAPATAAEKESVWAVLSFTGKPRGISLRPVGDTWQEVDCSTSSAELELELPAGEAVEIEVRAEWEEPAAVQALSLSLEPAGRETKAETQWKEEGSHTLHSIFTFRW